VERIKFYYIFEHPVKYPIKSARGGISCF